MTTQRSFRIATDIAWIVLLFATAALWLVFEGSQREGGSTAFPLMAIMVVKSAIIGSVFMDLWRQARVVLVLLVATMAIAGATIALLVS